MRVAHAVGIRSDCCSALITLYYMHTDDSLEKQHRDLATSYSALTNVLHDMELEKEKALEIAKDLEKFKLAVESASDHIIITDAHGVITYANRAVEEITGFSNVEVLSRRAGDTSLWGTEASHVFYAGVFERLISQKRSFIGEVENKRKNGERYITHTTISPIYDDDGNVEFFVGIDRDITKEKQIDTAKTEFVSVASHQLRTPLATANWYIEMLLAGDAGEISASQKKYLSEAYDSTQKMTTLVNALLNVSRLELGTFAIEPVTLSLAALVDEVVVSMQPLIMEKGMTVTTHIDDELQYDIVADKNLLSIVCSNFISNAIKYSYPTSVIEIRLEQKKEGEVCVGDHAIKTNGILLSVTDSGYGVPVQEKSRLYEKMFRAQNIRTLDVDGTGLGLYIVKKILDELGGMTWFISEENKGSTFYAFFPDHSMETARGSKPLDCA